MKPNMGTIDKIVRVLFAATVAVLYFMNFISGITVIILGVFALIFVVTSAVGFCPLYKIVNLSTRSDEK